MSKLAQGYRGGKAVKISSGDDASLAVTIDGRSSRSSVEEDLRQNAEIESVSQTLGSLSLIS